MASSSIHFKKATSHSSAHNTRADIPKYLLPEEHRLENEYWQNEKSARQLFDDELQKATRKGGPKPKFENSHWEAVLNLNAEHSLTDVQKVAKLIEKKFNITCTSIAVHRDEGHVKEGQPIYNYHAHLEFMTYQNGQQNWRREHVKNGLSELQTIVANELKMTRGKEGSEALRLDHKQYRVIAREQEAKEKEIVALKTENEALKYDFREYQKRITGLETENTDLKKELHRLNTQVNKGEATIQELEKRLSEALQSKKELEARVDMPEEEKNDFRASEGHYLRETMTLRREIKQIKEEHSKLKEEHSKLKMAYDSLCQHLQEITGYRVLVKAVEAIKAKFLPTQEAKREEKPKSAFKQLEEDITQTHKENPDTKKELSDKERLMQIADKIQREKEQNTQSVKTFVEEQKPKPKSSWRDR